MCQTLKVLDYLESAGVIPRSVCSRILYVCYLSIAYKISLYLSNAGRNIECQKIVTGRCWTSSTTERKTRSSHLFKRSTSLVSQGDKQSRETRFFILGNEHLVALLDGNFLRSSIRQQLDAEYRFPTAVGRQFTGASSVEDEKLRELSTNMESLETRVADWELTDSELTKFDDEVQMGFDVQLLTPDLLEQYPHLDPTKRSMKVCKQLLPRISPSIDPRATECWVDLVVNVCWSTTSMDSKRWKSDKVRISMRVNWRVSSNRWDSLCLSGEISHPKCVSNNIQW